MSEQGHGLAVCKANGCPLPVHRVTDYHPGKPGHRAPKWGLCVFHSLVEDATLWSLVTARVLTHAKTLKVLLAVQALEDTAKPLTGERVDDWIARVMQAMRDEILPSTRKAPPPADGFAGIKQVLGAD